MKSGSNAARNTNNKNEIIEKNEDRQYNYCGPDIPCFLNIEKWIITKIRVTSGKTNV